MTLAQRITEREKLRWQSSERCEEVKRMYSIHFIKRPLLFWGIVLVAILTRVCFLESLPMGINQDEAMGAMDALALSKYGTDRYGMRLPVHFTAWISCQMSVCLSYLMIPFIKVLGFTVYAIRLPLALVSVLSIVAVYETAKHFVSERVALGIMALTAICPWHFMQGRWALDCNMFPHMFLFGFMFLLKGFDKKRYLYLSMLFFGLTFYCYGIAIYTVPVFLFVYAIWCLLCKQFTFKDVMISVSIFAVVVLPEVITMFINLFDLETIETVLFTLPKFKYGVRSGENLFVSASKMQLFSNVKHLLRYGIFQQSDAIFNIMPKYGVIYLFSTPFYFVGTFFLIMGIIRESGAEQSKKMALLGFLMCGIWAGVVTNYVNVNRVNIIFYPLIMLTGYGINSICRLLKAKGKYMAKGIIMLYTVAALSFGYDYATVFAEEIKPWFSVDYLELIKKADAMDTYEVLYITDRACTQQNAAMMEILTQYALQIDAKYYQEESVVTAGRELLPYSERYHWTNVENMNWECEGLLYVLHEADLESIPVEYEVLERNASYAIVVKE